tara:strand:+ start:231 stop:935 length:705 start_codon:yes stop_codon:yes gene_type:complete
MKKYYVEAFLIFISVLSAFFLESYRENQSKIDLKNSLILELSTAIKQDLDQINRVKEVLNESVSSAKKLKNDFLSDKKLEDKELAVNFAKLRSMNVSYFPRDGLYNQLLNTGTLELIELKVLKNKLMYVYEHAMSRKQAVDLVIDEMGWRGMQNIAEDIVVIYGSEESQAKLITNANDEILENFYISKNYYDSKKVIHFYSQSISLMIRYLNIIDSIQIDLNETLLLIDKEFNL